MSNNLSNTSSTGSSNYYNVGTTNGYVTYPLSGFSSNNTPVVELLFPKQLNVYLIPNGKTVDSILNDKTDSISNYLIKPLLGSSATSDPNQQVYGFINIAWKYRLLPVTAWSQSSPTTITTYNYQDNTLNWIESNSFQETIAIYDSSLTTTAITPTDAVIPYITIGGYPLITIQQYLTYYTQLNNVNVPPTLPINNVLLANSPIVSSSTTLTSSVVKDIVTKYTDILSSLSSSDVSPLNASVQMAGFISYVRSLLAPTATSNSEGLSAYMIEYDSTTISFNSDNVVVPGLSALPALVYTSSDLAKPSTRISFVNNGGSKPTNGNFTVQWWRGNQPWESGDKYPSWQLLHGSYNQSSWNNWANTGWFSNSSYTEPNSPLFSNLFGENAPIVDAVAPANWGFTLYGFRGSVFSLTPNQALPGNLITQFQGSNLGTTNGASSFGGVCGENPYFTGLSVKNILYVTDLTSCSYTYQATSTNLSNEISSAIQAYDNFIIEKLKTDPEWFASIQDIFEMGELQKAINSLLTPFFFLPPLSFGTNPTATLFYNLIWDAQSEYIGLQYSQIDFMASTLSYNAQLINPVPVQSSVTLLVDDIKLVPLTPKLVTQPDLDDLSKMSQGYYSAADLMVSAYYNTQLQKIDYLLNSYNQVGKPTFLQLILAYAVKFNFTRELISEWVNGHPFNAEPEITSQLRYAINESINSNSSLPTQLVVKDNSNNSVSNNKTAQTNSPDGNSPNVVQPYEPLDSLNAINEFVNLTIPGWVNAYQLTPSIQSDVANAISLLATTTNDASVPGMFSLDFSSVEYIIPQMFRKIITKTMAMGAFIDLVHPHLTSMNIAQKALKSMGYTINSSSSSNDDVGTLPLVTQASSTDYSNAIGISQLTQSHYNLEDHFSSNLRPLIYPLFSDVTTDVEADVQRVRDICQDRLHGMQYAVYQPELKAIFSRRIKLTHSLIHYFTLGSKSLEQMFSVIDNVAREMNEIIGKTVDTLVLNPISHVLVAIAKFAVSAMLDMTDLVAPGSEILRIIDDAMILRPVPMPLTPFLDVDNDSNNINKNALFYNAIVNGSNANSTISSYECIVPWYGLTTRQNAANAAVIYNTKTKTYSLVVHPSGTLIAGNEPKPGSVNKDKTIAIMNNPAQANQKTWFQLSDVKPGLHCQRLATTAGEVDMWYSIDYTVNSDGNVGLNPNFQSWNIGQAAEGENVVLYNGLFCFVPVPVVELDGRVSLTKTMHKWCIAGIALPGIFFKGSQTASYVQNLSYLKSIPGFNNLTAHVAMSTEAICCTADAAAGTIGMISSALQLYKGVGSIQTDLEGYAVAAEDFANVAKVTSVYTQSQSANVMNSVANGITANSLTVNDILSQAWPTTSETYSLMAYNLFEDTVIDQPNNNVAAWYGQSWGRLLGDVLMGIGKLAYFLHAQHKVFKKWASTADKPNQNKVTVLGTLKNMIKNKWNRHKTIAGVDADIDKLNHSFLGSKDLSGLHTFELSNAKNIRSVLGDDNSILDAVKLISENVGGARGIN